MRSLIQTHTLASPFDGKRRTGQQEMEWLGIDNCDYERYEEMFLRPRERHHYIQKTPSGWIEIKHPWNKSLVLKHLTAERTIGLFPAHQLDYIMVDIDRHNNEDETTLRSRMKGVAEVIEGDPLVYQSSFSGGIRLCFFLPQPLDRCILSKGCRRLFQQKNLIVKPGSVEILAERKGDRLPFGEGSYLVDPFALEPIYHLTLRDTISEAYKIFLYQKIDIPFGLQTSDRDPVIYPPRESVFDLIVTQLYEEGLHPDITTNEALLKLSWDLIVRKGYSKEEAEHFLVSWIRQKHNGLSNRVNSGKMHNIIAQIRRIVQRVNPGLAKYPVSRYALRKKKLSLNDVRKIVVLTNDPKLRLAIFSLLEYCLNFRKNLHKRRSEKTKIGNKHYVSERRDVTYRSGFQKNFHCDISKKTLQHLPGFDKANPQITMQKIEELAVVSLKRQAHPRSHHCRQYWIHFPFDEEDPIKVVSLDEGLAKLKENRGNGYEVQSHDPKLVGFCSKTGAAEKGGRIDE